MLPVRLQEERGALKILKTSLSHRSPLLPGLDPTDLKAAIAGSRCTLASNWLHFPQCCRPRL
eukprot:NODE_13095_length_368_cov_1.981191_g11942_i0.p2 GENE.NODE_13095_length_368_cov_1.981191_g11942_i0~~NODE_13095_length_368_cov_1.981191_g11942_i0.p2  ORF type:complete len:62 (-),score=3.20 NODE_13095_length_368_cov_1.981191_g11942_i0:21-206(-)